MGLQSRADLVLEFVCRTNTPVRIACTWSLARTGDVLRTEQAAADPDSEQRVTPRGVEFTAYADRGLRPLPLQVFGRVEDYHGQLHRQPVRRGCVNSASCSAALPERRPQSVHEHSLAGRRHAGRMASPHVFIPAAAMFELRAEMDLRDRILGPVRRISCRSTARCRKTRRSAFHHQQAGNAGAPTWTTAQTKRWRFPRPTAAPPRRTAGGGPGGQAEKAFPN